MKVTITHDELKLGFIRKTTHYLVRLKVEFSGEEAAIIKTRDLGEVMIMDRDQPSHLGGDSPNPLLISRLGGKYEDIMGFTTPIEAKRYDAELREKMQELKAYIDGNATIEEKSSSFEL